MTQPARNLRAIGQENHPDDYQLTVRQHEREERIVAISTSILAEVGTENVTFADLAVGLRIGTGTLRFHFCDLHVLLKEILVRHLLAIARTIGEISQNAPDCEAKRQAAYHAYTTTPGGFPTAPQLLLERDRHLLPPDLLHVVDVHRQQIARTLGSEKPPAKPKPLLPAAAPMPRLVASTQLPSISPAHASREFTLVSEQRAKPERKPSSPAKPSLLQELLITAAAAPIYKPALHPQ